VVASSASLAVLAGVYTIAVLTEAGQSIEDSILRSVDGTTLLQSGVALDAISPPAVLLVVALTMVVAFLRRRPGSAVQAGVLIVGATVTTQLLKQLAPRPELTGELYGNSFPSGHVTVAVAAVLAIMTTFGRHARPLFYMIGAAFAAVVAEQTVAFGWHRCSDVVGACAVALLWLGLVRIGAARLSRDPLPHPVGGHLEHRHRLRHEPHDLDRPRGADGGAPGCSRRRARHVLDRVEARPQGLTAPPA
jgi:membrane-associated phospholipid phosphatase